MLFIIEIIFVFILLAFCLIASYKDIKTNKIPNWIPITLFVIWIFEIILKWMLAANNIIDMQVIDVLVQCGKQVLTSGVICCILAACIVLINKRRKRMGQAQHSVFGMGDIKLLMVVCLFLGFNNSLICLLIACLSFIVYATMYKLTKKEKLSVAPFAPFIFIGLILVLVLHFI